MLFMVVVAALTMGGGESNAVLHAGICALSGFGFVALTLTSTVVFVVTSSMLLSYSEVVV